MKYFILILILLNDWFAVQAQQNCLGKLPDLIPYRKGTKWGYCNKNKKIIIPCKYLEANFFYKGKALVEVSKDAYKYINTKGVIVGAGSLIGEAEIGAISSNNNVSNEKRHDDGLTIVQGKNYKWGIVNNKNDTLVAFKYDWIEPDENNEYRGKNDRLFHTRINRQQGIVLENGNEIIQPKYDGIELQYGGYYIVTLDRKKGMLDKDGKLILDIKYDYIVSFWDSDNQGLFEVVINGKSGFVSCDGTEYFSN